MQDHKQDLAVMLRRLRLDCGYSQKAVATGLGVERSTYSNYELGKVSPDLDTLRRLAQIYAVPLEAFLYPEEYRTIEAARQRPPKKINSSPGRIGELSSQEKELSALLRAGIITV